MATRVRFNYKLLDNLNTQHLVRRWRKQLEAKMATEWDVDFCTPYVRNRMVENVKCVIQSNQMLIGK